MVTVLSAVSGTHTQTCRRWRLMGSQNKQATEVDVVRETWGKSAGPEKTRNSKHGKRQRVSLNASTHTHVSAGRPEEAEKQRHKGGGRGSFGKAIERTEKEEKERIRGKKSKGKHTHTGIVSKHHERNFIYMHA